MTSIYLAGGCFWCIESAFLLVKGIEKVTPGYLGGNTKNPNYSQVCTGETGHAEAIKLNYFEDKISLKNILDIFFLIHDPTQLNRQGNDIGSQYRSATFVEKKEQLKVCKIAISNLKIKLKENIYTELLECKTFYPAEEYHHDYYNKNPNSAYCNISIPPKLDKLKLFFPHFIKS